MVFLNKIQLRELRSMSLFSQTITDFWWGQFLNVDVLYSHEVFTVVINPNLSTDR